MSTSSPADFMTTRLFPFVGRKAERERLLTFWRSMDEAQELRAALVVGEAGIGKSRLLEEILPSIAGAGGVTVHVKLYPESSRSIMPLVTRAIFMSESGRQFQRRDVGTGADGAGDETMASVALRLRRLARLRRTLLVIEDAHLLEGEALAELGLLLDSLSDESLAVLFLARPLDMNLRGIVERYLAEEIELKGFTTDDLSQFWESIFNSPADGELIRSLGEATLGNPLALRSALRAAVRSGAIAPDGNTRSWHAALLPRSFADSLTRNVRLLSEGMTAHLTGHERRSAERLASLGEVFARETAGGMLDDADGAIEILSLKGVIIPVATPMLSLTSRGSNHPLLTFTHTLLHRHLVEGGSPDVDQLASLVAERLPLYSILPYQLISERGADLSLSRQTARAAVEGAVEVVRRLQDGVDWELGNQVWQGASVIAAMHDSLWSEVESNEIGAMLLGSQVQIYSRWAPGHAEKYPELIATLLDLTFSATTDLLLEHRLLGLLHRHRLSLQSAQSGEGESPDQLSGEIDALVREHPGLRHTRPYLMYLHTIARIAGMATVRNNGVLRSIEERLGEIVSNDDAPEEYRNYARTLIEPQLINLFESHDELQQRLAYLSELEHRYIKYPSAFAVSKIMFFDQTGYARRVVEICDRAIPRFRDEGLVRNVIYASLHRICCLAALGRDLDETLAEINSLIASAPETLVRGLRENSLLDITTVTLLRGEREWTSRCIDELVPGDSGLLMPRKQVMIAIAAGTLVEELPRLILDGRSSPALHALIALLLAENEMDLEMVEQEVTSALGNEILRIDDLVELRGLVELIAAGDSLRPELSLRESFGDIMAAALGRGVEWCLERGLFWYMKAFLDDYGVLLPATDLRRWKNTLAADLKRDAAERAMAKAEQHNRTELSMIGTISIQRPGQDPHQPRGGRLRILLGLMVADRMLKSPLSAAEFRRVASGGEEDASGMLRTAIHRLREIMGSETVVRDAEKPMINLDLVRVDLLQATRLLDDAVAAIRDGSPIRARTALSHAHDLIDGDIPFPSLYGDFFEALREDFDFRLRNARLTVARGLLHEGDPESVEELLTRVVEQTPDDEELSGLLCDALLQLGRRADADRVRRRVVES